MNESNSNNSNKMYNDENSGAANGQNGGGAETHAASTADIFRDGLSTVMKSVIEAVEPEAVRMATEATQAIYEHSKEIAGRAYTTVQRRPAYLAGVAGLLLLAAATVFALENRQGRGQGVQPKFNRDLMI